MRKVKAKSKKSKRYKNLKEWLDRRIEEDKKSMITESDTKFLEELTKMMEDNNPVK